MLAGTGSILVWFFVERRYDGTTRRVDWVSNHVLSCFDFGLFMFLLEISLLCVGLDLHGVQMQMQMQIAWFI
jgi:hypothetical protein